MVLTLLQFDSHQQIDYKNRTKSQIKKALAEHKLFKLLDGQPSLILLSGADVKQKNFKLHHV